MLVERVAALWLVQGDMRHAVHNFEGECGQFHLSDLANGWKKTKPQRREEKAEPQA